MDTIQDDRYTAGYLAGYRDGIRDVLNNRCNKMIENNTGNLPIDVMTVSTQARNCLRRAGCITVLDVAELDEHTIITTRNMGARIAAEIAKWMHAHGYPYTAWTLFL